MIEIFLLYFLWSTCFLVSYFHTDEALLRGRPKNLNQKKMKACQLMSEIRQKKRLYSFGCCSKQLKVADSEITQCFSAGLEDSREKLYSLNFRKYTDHLERRVLLKYFIFFFFFFCFPPRHLVLRQELQFVLAAIIQDSDLTWISCLPKRTQFCGSHLYSHIKVSQTSDPGTSEYTVPLVSLHIPQSKGKMEAQQSKDRWKPSWRLLIDQCLARLQITTSLSQRKEEGEESCRALSEAQCLLTLGRSCTISQMWVVPKARGKPCFALSRANLDFEKTNHLFKYEQFLQKNQRNFY